MHARRGHDAARVSPIRWYRASRGCAVKATNTKTINPTITMQYHNRERETRSKTRKRKETIFGRVTHATARASSVAIVRSSRERGRENKSGELCIRENETGGRICCRQIFVQASSSLVSLVAMVRRRESIRGIFKALSAAAGAVAVTRRSDVRHLVSVCPALLVGRRCEYENGGGGAKREKRIQQ